jgi:hypothetical protein
MGYWDKIMLLCALIVLAVSAAGAISLLGSQGTSPEIVYDGLAGIAVTAALALILIAAVFVIIRHKKKDGKGYMEAFRPVPAESYPFMRAEKTKKPARTRRKPASSGK